MPYILKAEQLESQTNKVTVINESVTHEQYPSAKAIYDNMYTEEQAGCVSKGTFKYFENAKGGTDVELTANDYGDYNLTVCGANLVKPIEITKVGGVTFTKCDDGGISIVGKATEDATVPVTDSFCTYAMPGDLMVSGEGLYIALDIYPLETTILLEKEGYIIKQGTVLSEDDQGVYKLAFKIEAKTDYNHTVYPMGTLGAGKKPFEPYKDYRTLYLPDPPETTTFTFPEDGDYYIFEMYGECPFSCSAYTKKISNYIPSFSM